MSFFIDAPGEAIGVNTCAAGSLARPQRPTLNASIQVLLHPGHVEVEQVEIGQLDKNKFGCPISTRSSSF